MKNTKTFGEFTNSLVNEKIKFGSYYFSKYAFDGFDLPGKGETHFALILHNTVEVNAKWVSPLPGKSKPSNAYLLK